VPPQKDAAAQRSAAGGTAPHSNLVLLEGPPAVAGGLRVALEQANLPTLLAALAHLTGDERWMQDPYRPANPRGAEDHDSAGLPPDVQAHVRTRAFEIISAWRAGRLPPAPDPSPERIAEMLSISLGGSQNITPEMGPLLAAELGVGRRDVELPTPPPGEDFRVLVIGSGFSGLCAAIRLEQAGIAYTVLEKNATVGGTWLENTYPNCGVDTPSHLYSLSFAQSPDWSRYFARRHELYAYLEQLADDYGVRPHVLCGREVHAADWDNEEQRWHVRARCGDGTSEVHTANVVISGVGILNRPSYPEIAGLDRFEGPCMHTARWRSDVDVRGKRVAVIGTGASAMQLVPAIAGVAERVIVFQRSPQWGLPNANHTRDVSPATKLLMREVPHYLGWYRLRLVWNFGDRLYPALQVDAEWPHPERAVNAINDRHREYLTDYIRSELGERRDLLPKCLPAYPPYGKRPLLDNGWFRTMARDDVDLVTDPIAEIRADRVVTAGGEAHRADILVLATGFQAVRPLGQMEIRGRSGATLRECWGEDDAKAYLGISVPDFPNFFFLLGPNTFAAHGGSAALSIEMEMCYVMGLLAHMLEQGLSSVECRQEAYDAYLERLDRALSKTIWAHTGMTTYYRNKFGRIVVPMPWTNVDYWYMTREPDIDDFHVVAAVAAA
jgi:4-hydroxyacetophenone monooxygenase